MNVKMLLLMGLLCASPYQRGNAMTAAESAIPMVTLVLDEQHKYQIPAETVPMLGILQLAGYDEKTDEYFLPGSNLEPAILKVFTDILQAVYILPERHPELRAIGAGEKYLDAIINAIKLKVRITPESLFAWSDYLNFSLGIYLAGKMLLQKPLPSLPSGTTFPDTIKPQELLRYVSTLVQENGLSEDSFKVFVKFISLSSAAAKASMSINVEGIKFSIRDYLDFRPERIIIKPSNDPNEKDLVEIILEGLNLVSLEGLNDIPKINEAVLLNLSGNELISIRAHEFAAAPKLAELLLRKNQIREVHEQAFNTLLNLQAIDLRKNQLTYLHSKTFQNNRMIEYINLSANFLRFFDPNTFNTLFDLRVVLLGGNQIKTVNPIIFNNLPYATIYLTGNPLSKETKELIIKWDDEKAIERISKYPNYMGRYYLDMTPFIEFDEYKKPPPKDIQQVPN